MGRVGPQPASVRNVADLVVVGHQPDHGAGEPVGDHRVHRRLEQPRAVALPTLLGVDRELHQLPVGHRVAVGVGGRSRDREADDAVALQGDERAVAGVRWVAERVAPQLGEVGSAAGRPQPAPARRTTQPRRGPGSRRWPRRRPPRRCGPRRRRRGCSWAHRGSGMGVTPTSARMQKSVISLVRWDRVRQRLRHRRAAGGRATRSEQAFTELLADEGRIEPRDEMPEAYRKSAGPADRPARPLRDHRHAARGQLDQPRAEPAPQGDPDGEGAGRGRPRPLPVRRGRDARRRPGRPGRPAALRPAEVLLDLQLPDPHLGRRRRDRLAGRRCRDHQPGAAVPLLLRPLRPGDGARVQGGVVPPAAGLRDPPHALARHARAEGDGPGCRQPLLVAVADDVRPAGRRLAELRPVDGVGHQAVQQRRAAAALRRHDRAAVRGARADPARPRPPVERGARQLRLRRDRLHRAVRGDQGQRPVQRRADGPQASVPMPRARGSARPPTPTRTSTHVVRSPWHDS